MIVDAHLHCSGAERLFAQLTAERADPRRIGTLHEARPIRANGASVKSASAAAPR